MPLYSNLLLKGYKGIKGYGYPLVSTWLQVNMPIGISDKVKMLGVVIVLLAFNTITHVMRRKDLLEKSWVFGEGLWWKW